MSVNGTNYTAPCIQFLIQKIRESAPCNSLKNTAIKVAKLALVALVFPFALLIDLIILTGTLANRCFTFCFASTPPSMKKPSFNFDKIKNNYVAPPQPSSPKSKNDVDFLKKSIEEAFKIIDHPENHKEMITNQGCTNDGESPFDIFQWTANCLILYACRNPEEWKTLFGKTFKGIQIPQASYSNLDEEQKALCSYMLLVHRDSDLPGVNKDFVKACEEISGDLIQNEQFNSLFGKLKID